MKRYVKASTDSITVDTLAQYVANYFNGCLDDVDDYDDCQSLNDLIDLYDWSSDDVKEEIYYTLRELRNKNFHKDEWELYDDCSVDVQGEEYSYRKFKSIVTKYIGRGKHYDIGINK